MDRVFLFLLEKRQQFSYTILIILLDEYDLEKFSDSLY